MNASVMKFVEMPVDIAQTICVVLLTNAAKQFTDDDRLRPACSMQCVPFVFRLVRQKLQKPWADGQPQTCTLLKAFDAVLARMP